MTSVQRRHLLGAGAAVLAGCATPGPTPSTPGTPTTPPFDPPPVPREFRAAWVATVVNIDWPSKPGLSGEQQRAEALAMLDRAAAVGLNALILQVRPAGDAIYPSALEPWTEYLSGEQGRAPDGAWDPLAFWVAEAHRRGLELHAWFNPYRARHSSAKTPLVSPHIGVRAPGLVKRYGDLLWMDPGEPAAAAHTLAVVADVVRRYDIDGVHIDDYFYPYPVNAGGAAGGGAGGGAGAVEVPFPDDPAFARYTLAGGTLTRADWRRDNVDRLVQQMHKTVHEIKPWLRFGISPFGIGKPARRPAGITGFSQYDKLYADVERWVAESWLDYLAPQLYWPIDRVGQQFPVLLDHWIAESRLLQREAAGAAGQRHVWSGLYTSQVTRGEPLGPRAWPARELLDQVAQTRNRAAAEPLASGHIHFSMVALMQDRDGIATQLRTGTYAQPALVPACPWLGGGSAAAPAAPRLRPAAGGSIEFAPGPASGEGGSHAVAGWALWRRRAGQWRFDTLPAAERRFEVAGADTLALAAVDRIGTLGAWQTLQPAG